MWSRDARPWTSRGPDRRSTPRPPLALVAVPVALALVAVPAAARESAAARAPAAQGRAAAPASAYLPWQAADYPLVAPAARVPAAPVSAPAASTIHGPYSMTADKCAVCHRSHTGRSANLVTQASGQSALCFTCHDGTGAADVKSAFTSTSIPPDDPGRREYYGHDVLRASAHISGRADEFGGVKERHSECADCHNPHRAAGSAGATESADGWAASGALAGVSGVSVVNGAAGTSPRYTYLDGVSAPITKEYQLCLKCHSGYTVLPANEGLPPSRHLLDKGVEFNPNNPSYHPVEAAGRNRTAAMAAGLAGPSPYKRWTFTPTSTIRCVNCHADGTATGGAPPSAGDAAPSHRSANRGMLLRNYRDRVLKPAGERYAAADFALCYLCHAESPFVGKGGTATNFRLHAKHVSSISGEGSGGTDIDTPGAGQGNALCAECHYRIHSVTYKVDGQTVSGSRLVNFAPDVIAAGGELSWTAGATSGGTCTLTCHGEDHNAERY